MIQVVRTKHIGFCYGVNRAVSMVLKAAEETGSKIYTLGPLLHNPQMVSLLAEKGIGVVRDVRDLNSGILAFRSHGVLKEEEEYVREKGIRFIDATCPFVKRVRRHALSLRRNGYRVVVVGNKDHPEVRSVLSYLDNDGMVLQNPFSIETKKVGVVCQTTIDQEMLTSVVQGLVAKVDELRVYNTICDSTSVRRREALELSTRVDAMLIVGGRNSSNTTGLYEVVKKVQGNTHHIETEEDLAPEWLSGASTVGIAGGASTPEFIIKNVERRVKNL